MYQCHYCQEEYRAHEVRPYGPGGAFVCFSCATKPENKAATEEQFKALLDGAGPVAVIGDSTGPRAPTPAELLASLGPPDPISALEHGKALAVSQGLGPSKKRGS